MAEQLYYDAFNGKWFRAEKRKIYGINRKTK